MIKLIRLDERLIHGQVAIKWSRHTGVDRIVVLNKEAAENDIIQKSLMMAAPTTAKVAIKDIESGISLLNDPRCGNLKILVIVSDINDLIKVLENVKGIPLVNIGNYGRIAPKQDGIQRATYRRNLYAYESEVELFKKVISLVDDCNYQTIPEDSPESLAHVLGIK
ncbi:MAG: PTS sugar transporter subunit IIB [Bacilli bacterium]